VGASTGEPRERPASAERPVDPRRCAGPRAGRRTV